MLSSTAMIHVRVNENIKEKAAEALSKMGLSVSDAVRMLLVRVATEKAMPFPIKVPNAETLEAIREAETAILPNFSTVKDLMESLNEEK